MTNTIAIDGGLIDGNLTNGGSGEIRVACLDAAGLHDLAFFRATADVQEGDVFLARVTKAPSGLDGAFLSLGPGLEGFLPVRKAKSRPNEGALIPVRIRTGARASKRITASRDLSGAPADLIARECDAGGKPRLIWRDPERWMRGILDRADDPDLEVRVEDADLFRALKSRCLESAPALVGRLVLDQGASPLFDRLGIEEEIEALFEPCLPLPGGGTITIEDTAAGTAIDVDTGTASGPDMERVALAVNREAVRLITRQLRLRRTGGLVFIDFVTLRAARSRKALQATLDQALDGEDPPWERTGLSRFGVVELNRARSQTPLMDDIGHSIQSCTPNAATEGHAILRQLTFDSRTMPGQALVVKCRADTARWLKETEIEGKPILDLTAQKLHVQVILEPAQDIAKWAIHGQPRA
jgi:Ribonuclease G/E